MKTAYPERNDIQVGIRNNRHERGKKKKITSKFQVRITSNFKFYTQPN